MKRLTMPVLVVAAIAVVAGGVVMTRKAPDGTPAAAQQQSQERGAQGGGGGGRFSQFREQHKYTFMLSRMATNIGRLDTESQAPLTESQAKSILTVLTPLRTKPTLTQDEAKGAIKGLKAVLTPKQLTEIGRMKQPEHRFRSTDQGGRPGGGQSQGQRPHFDMSAMKDFNPFNPPKDSPMAGRSAKRLNALFDALDAKSKGQ